MPKADLYKITINDGKVMLRIPQQLVGAETANIDDIQQELHMMGVDYIPEKLLEIYNRTSGEFDFLTEFKTTNFSLQIDLSDDESKAYLNVIPPKEVVEELSLEKVIEELKEKNILQGINYKIIEKIIEKKIYYEPTVVSRGKTAKNGKNGFPELLFLPEKSRPVEGAKINLNEIPVLQKVEKGQKLVRIEMASMGQDGYTITGRLIVSKPGKQFRIRPGRNTQFNPEGTHIVATKSGVVCINNDSISVENFKVINKVDATTGQVRFDGIISIRGNVSDRCSVEAVRIDIGGSVGKARLRSIGEIRVAQGINGAVVQCGSSLRANNILDTQAIVGEHAIVEENVLNSKIYCGSTFQILSKSGYFSGGEIQAGSLIRIPNVGLSKTKGKIKDSKNENDDFIQSILEVGISIKNRKQFNELEKLANESMNSLQGNIQEITSIIEEIEEKGWENAEFKTLNELESKANKNLLNAFSNLRKREVMDEINDLNRITNGGVVFIPGDIYTGTAINIRRSRFNVRNDTKDKAYSFVENGIQADFCSELLDRYEKYFFKMPD